ncbi:PLP-dependent aminotransferase family protein (plasmid) [Aureimonas ureilytica]|uniref:aminotransferase-like domain-containing protein n=1 Tax=Aureimonas ureilytica TaxID=401562 RepID=UPI003CF44C24
MDDWTPDLSRSDKPRYMALADAIESDILDGLLPAGTRLPPQRRLADRLRIDFTTVARGYVEAQKRGLLVSHVGRGSFVADGAPERLRRERPAPSSFARPTSSSRTDFTMNLPPEPQDPDLLSRMETGVSAVLRNMRTLLRYQGFGGAPGDKDAASNWLGRRAMVPTQDRLFVTPGAHAALVGILSLLSSPGDVLLCEAVTYPGIRSIAAQKGLRLVGLAMDRDGILPDAFRAACRTLEPKALYLNPTLHNPTTLTIPASRRAEIARVAREFGVPIVEDDAYGFVPDHGEPPFAAVAPDLTWHIAGLAKCIGAGLRVAYVVAPDARSAWPFVAAMAAANVMASPVTAAIATRWIEDGTADAILAFIRTEARARQRMAREILDEGSFRGAPLAFNLWLPLPEGWTRSSFAGQMRGTGVGVVTSDAFVVDGANPPETVRLCLGGPIQSEDLRKVLTFVAHSLAEAPERAPSFW